MYEMSCLELHRCIITEQLLHEAGYDTKARARWITPSEICISSYNTKAEINKFKIFTRQYETVTENNLVNDIKVAVHHLLEKCQNNAFCLCCGR